MDKLGPERSGAESVLEVMKACLSADSFFKFILRNVAPDTVCVGDNIALFQHL